MQTEFNFKGRRILAAGCAAQFFAKPGTGDRKSV